jgi:signal recognition particle subunit SRP68
MLCMSCISTKSAPQEKANPLFYFRQYCTRRLARLYKALTFSHGRGRYQKKALEAATVTDERHLLIPLMTAERAWSYAMELKRDVGNEPIKRAHMIRRLKKATVHAAELVVGSSLHSPP